VAEQSTTSLPLACYTEITHRFLLQHQQKTVKPGEQTMELSPLAKEKLAKIGDLSPSEKEGLKLAERLTSLLADYFTERIDLNALWLELKKQKEQGHEFMIKETQVRLLNAITLSSNKSDFERYRDAILGCETLKERGAYSELEHGFKLLENLRQRYQQEKEEAFNAVKESLRKQVEMAARQLLRQSANKDTSIDIQSSVEASARTSPQWRSFLMEHEKIYGQKFTDIVAKIKGML